MLEEIVAKFSVAIVDDDLQGRRLLRNLISQYDSMQLVGEAGDGQQATLLIEKMKPQAVFLDIMMPQAGGFEVLRRLQIPPKVVFVTSSLSHALEAIEIDAVDYLVKPVKPSRFGAAVRRLERIFELEGTLAERHELNDRLCVRSDGKTHFVPIHGLVALEAEGDFTRFSRVENTGLLICQPLKHYEEILPTPPFIRLDRSLIINLERFIRIDRSQRNRAQLWLRGLKSPLNIGRTATERLRDYLGHSH